MTREEFIEFEKLLVSNGYNKYSGWQHNASFTYYKSFGKGNNKYDDERSLYQIGFSVYNFEEYADRNPHLKFNPISIQPVIMVSRIIDERIDLDVMSDYEDETSIKRVEEIADSFFKWVEDNIKIKETLIVV